MSQNFWQVIKYLHAQRGTPEKSENYRKNKNPYFYPYSYCHCFGASLSILKKPLRIYFHSGDQNFCVVLQPEFSI
jgi:hypothetical protein